MKYFVKTTLSAANAATTQNATPSDMSTMVAISAQAILTGSPVGTLTFQASNDLTYNGQTQTNWTTIPNTSVAVNSAGTYLLPKIDSCYQWVRVVYTATSGTGTVTVNVKALGF